MKVCVSTPVPGTPPDRQRARAERMLARAQKRHRQAAKLVEKWKLRLANLDRAGVAARQAKLWADEHPDGQSATDTL